MIEPAHNEISLAEQPKLPEESWRRFDPAPFFSAVETSPNLAIKSYPCGDLREAARVTGYSWLGALADAEEQNIGDFSVVSIGSQTVEIHACQSALERVSVSLTAIEHLRSIFLGSAVGTAIASRFETLCPAKVSIMCRGEPPLTLIVIAGSDISVAQTHLVTEVTVAELSDVRLCVRDMGGALAVHRHEVVVKSGAKVEEFWWHSNLESSRDDSSKLLERLVLLSDDAKFRDVVFLKSQNAVRAISNILLEGARANSKSGAAIVTSGKAKIDFEPIQQHIGNAGRSELKARMVASDQSRAIFQGLILVPLGVSGTVALQDNKNLILSPEARIQSTPRLEIFPADVVCKHGSATAEIDPRQVYYLNTRGFDDVAACALVTEAFVIDVVGVFAVESPLRALATASIGSID